MHNIYKNQTIPLENKHSMAKLDFTFFYFNNVKKEIGEIIIYNIGRKSSNTKHKCNPILLYIIGLRIKRCFL